MKIDLDIDILSELDKLKAEYREDTYSQTIKTILFQLKSYRESVKNQQRFMDNMVKSLSKENEDLKNKNKEIHIYHHFEK
jgi:hypothetical protein